MEAIVVHSEPVSHIKSILKNADYQLRNILKIHNTELFDVSFLKMSQEIAQYHASYTGLVIDTLTPKAILNARNGSFSKPHRSRFLRSLK